MRDDATSWQFWIDVGGTFTDCVACRPDGAIVRRKVLSSGVTKGAIGAGSTASAIVDTTRAGDVDRFWVGYRLRIEDAEGSQAETNVVGFEADNNTLILDPPLAQVPQIGQHYELTSSEEAPILAIRKVLGLRIDEALPACTVRLGTTRGTNALLTRRGAKTAFVTTAGFGDVLRIGYQNRPKLFELAIHKPVPLFSESIEIAERVTHDGEILKRPDETTVRTQLAELKSRGIESLAVCLLHGASLPEHERFVARIAKQVGFDEVSISSDVAQLFKIVARGDTTVVDAYLNPVLRQYVTALRTSLGENSLRILTSAGGLVDADKFTGKDSILSGPAGGVVGLARVAEAAGYRRALGFDMGGTSTDVSRYDGQFQMQYETEKAGVRIAAPMMAIETVAAGGGSVCHFDGVKLTVGPDSAGAEPGPACYGRGGPLAVTDINFFLGKISAERFPFPLSATAVRERLTLIREEIAEKTGKQYQLIELANGFLEIANAKMASAIRSISVAQGCDPREYVLVAFGAAAGQHACAVARELGIAEVLNHPDAGILSAYGIGLADVARHAARAVDLPLTDTTIVELQTTFAELEESTQQQVLAEGVAAERITTRRSLDLRYRGLDAYLTIDQPADGDWQQAYIDEHRKRYGYVHEDRPLEIVAARVEANGKSESTVPATNRVERKPRTNSTTATCYFSGQQHDAAVFEREQLTAGDVVTGPAIIFERFSTTIVDPNWEAEMLSRGELVLRDLGQRREQTISTQANPTQLEVFNNHFAEIAEQMGITLRNTSSSVNVKERLDFSCAIFTASGDLVVNAPHIPVHLGAMSETVRHVLTDNPDMQPGDVIVTNNPYRGGSHLPDVTVVTPVHNPDTGQLLFVTASRAHHAEIGGTVPGSMPPFSKNLAEEGVLLANFKLIDAGHSQVDELERTLREAPYPSRNPSENLADINAQVAANQQGARDLLKLTQQFGIDVVQAYMGHIQRAAEAKMRQALANLPDGRHTFVDYLDDGSPIHVAITIDGDAATVDFTGTGDVLAGNLNANPAIVKAALMYCLRLLIDEDIPLNQGVLTPVKLILPECLLNPPADDDPSKCPAVVGGNVETSQRVVDVLLGALQLAAASQGTMNNLLFGDDTFGYYETICGGAGATRDADGADAVHTHMTNTRLTDPEVLERRYPVRLQQFAIRRGSGGRGKYSGGDGVVRQIEFLRPLDVSILSQRRGEVPPYGLAGGASGAIGRNTLKRADGHVEELAGQTLVRVNQGDVLTIETPGGGGFGE